VKKRLETLSNNQKDIKIPEDMVTKLPDAVRKAFPNKAFTVFVKDQLWVALRNLK